MTTLASAPAQISVPFATGDSSKATIPVASQIGTNPGRISYTTGFVPLNATPIASGGIPPFMEDMNGLLYAMSNSLIWGQMGGEYPFNATFATAIGGYPKGAMVLSANSNNFWLSTVDNNTTNPDTAISTSWKAIRPNGDAVALTVTSGAVTPTAAQLGAEIFNVTGALTANATLVLPLVNGYSFTVANNTTGAFTFSVIGATGSGVTIPTGQAFQVWTDGTNWYGVSSAVSGAYLPIGGTAVAATKLATGRTLSTFAAGSPVTWTMSPTTFDGTSNITFTTALNATGVSAAVYGGGTQGAQISIAADGRITSANNITLAFLPLAGGTITGGLTINGTTTLNAVTAQGSINANAAQLQLRSPDTNIANSVNNPSTGLVMNSALSGGSGDAAYINFVRPGNYGVNVGLDSDNILKIGGGSMGVVANPIFHSGNSGTMTWNVNATLSGVLTAATIISGQTLTSSNTTGIIAANGTATTGTGSIIVRPNGANNGTGASTFTSAGGLTLAAGLTTGAGSTIGGALQVNGTISSTGTVSFNTSDRRLKKSIAKVEPQPFHRKSKLVEYVRTDTGEKGRGLLAQDMQKMQPLYACPYDHPAAKGRTVKRMAIATANIALEQAWWASEAVDELQKQLFAALKRIAKLEKR